MHATGAASQVQREVMGMTRRTIRGTLSHDVLRVLKCATKTVAMRTRGATRAAGERTAVSLAAAARTPCREQHNVRSEWLKLQLIL